MSISSSSLDSPQIGEIRDSFQIGKAWKGKYIWHACESCGKTRWIHLIKGKPQNVKCLKCSRSNKGFRQAISARKTGPNNHNWKGGKCRLAFGYVGIKVFPSDFYFPMANHNHYVPEHRLIIAKHLNRCLLAWEVVHHKNGIKNDNRLENLALLRNQGNHNGLLNRTVKQQTKRIEILQIRILQLETEIVLLNEALDKHLKGERIQPATTEVQHHNFI